AFQLDTNLVESLQK
nr:RecName: Full=Germin-like protein 2 [Betula pendula]